MNRKYYSYLSIFGNSLVQGISDNLGIKLDRVNFTTKKDGKLGFEIEKRLNDKVTIMYQNDTVQTIKIKYQNTDEIESDFTFSPEYSGIDIIYKNEK